VGIVSVMDLPLRWAMTRRTTLIDNEPTTTNRRRQRLAGALGLLLAGGIAGGVLAANNSATAATTPAASAAAPSVGAPAAPGAPGAPGSRAPADSATSVRAGEKAQTGTNLATLKAAALKAVPGGTVYRVETDVDGATYEAHMTKADGTHVTVKFDKSFKVTGVENGMGAGGPGGPGGRTAGGTSLTSAGAGV
jgi:hypothetical protein